MVLMMPIAESSDQTTRAGQAMLWKMDGTTGHRRWELEPLGFSRALLCNVVANRGTLNDLASEPPGKDVAGSNIPMVKAEVDCFRMGNDEDPSVFYPVT